MAARGEIAWSPTHRDQFMVVDSDMILYKLDRHSVEDLHSVATNTLTHWVSNASTATLLCKNGDFQHNKCSAWHPRSADFGQELVAVGYSNGRVLLASPSVQLSPHFDTADESAAVSRSQRFDQNGDGAVISGISVVGKEFIPKHIRPCQSLRWNVHQTQWLAIGLEKHRSDNGIFIWDVFSRSASNITSSYDPVAAPSQHQHHSQQANSLSHRDQHFPISQQLELSTLQNPSPGLIDNRRFVPVDNAMANNVLPSTQPSSSSASAAPSQQHTRALFEFAGGESAHSLVWQSPKCLLCGLSGKYIRLYDTRDPSKVFLQITTRGVYGLALDPFSDKRLCSYVDNQLLLWDLRHTEKPLLVITDQKPYSKVQWDPVRRNVFSSLCKDSSIVKVYHLQQIIAEETELSYTENHVQPPFLFADEPTSGTSASAVISYDWHPQDECHLLCLNAHGVISDFWVNERLCARWSPDGMRLLTSFGKMIAELKHFHLSEETTPVGDRDDNAQQQDEDISIVMHRRATLGYGVLGDNANSDESKSLKQNAELCANDGGGNSTAVAWTWTWMDKLRQISDCETAETWPYDTSFPGIQHVLRASAITKLGVASNIEYRPMTGLDAAAGHTSMFRVFSSPERDRIMQFCGWGSVCAMARDRAFSIGGGAEAFLQDLLDNKQGERAAAIALFTLRLRTAVQILTKAASTSDDKSHLQLTALALAGYPGAPTDRDQSNSNASVGVVSTPTALASASTSSVPASAVASVVSATSLWVDQCNTILTKLTNPYLRAMFQFLACRATGGNNFEPLLESSDFPLHDKVAFAAMFAPDQRLEELVDALSQQCVAKGELYGLLLTGLGSEQCLELIQRYIDTTGDVQTGALLIIYGGVSSVSSAGDVTPSSLTSSVTASVPTMSVLRDNNTVVNRIVDSYFGLLDSWGQWHVRAQTSALYLKRSQTLTGKVSPQIFITCTYCARSILTGTGGRLRQRMQKLGSCPSCKKPLPRCALCRLNVGMPIASEQVDASKPNRFASWFAWCQSCRHGGHAQHLSDWFMMNTECPVTGCSCKCAALDASSDFSQLLSALMKNDT